MRKAIRTLVRRSALAGSVTVLALVCMMSPDAAAAAQPESADDAALKSGGEAGKTSVYDFDDDSVDGELLRPEGANIASRSRKKHASLITIRAHFISELIRLADDI